jgi:hypothetical protein
VTKGPLYDPSLTPFYDIGRVRYIHETHLTNIADRCVQCRAEPDGTEWLLTPKSGGEPVLLHEQCWCFYKS